MENLLLSSNNWPLKKAVYVFSDSCDVLYCQLFVTYFIVNSLNWLQAYRGMKQAAEERKQMNLFLIGFIFNFY
jgi:hypothetical protein